MYHLYIHVPQSLPLSHEKSYEALFPNASSILLHHLSLLLLSPFWGETGRDYPISLCWMAFAPCIRQAKAPRSCNAWPWLSMFMIYRPSRSAHSTAVAIYMGLAKAPSLLNLRRSSAGDKGEGMLISGSDSSCMCSNRQRNDHTDGTLNSLSRIFSVPSSRFTLAFKVDVILNTNRIALPTCCAKNPDKAISPPRTGDTNHSTQRW